MSKISNKETVLLIFFLMLVALYLLIKNWQKGKANIFIRIYNFFKYPIFIEYNTSIWRVSKNIKNQFKIHKTPICTNCYNTFKYKDYYYFCTNCNNTNKIRVQSSVSLSDEAESLKNDLEIYGLKYFKNSIVKKLKHNN
jgi:hypothetical protein